MQRHIHTADSEHICIGIITRKHCIVEMTIIIFVHPFAGISDPPLYFYRDKDMNEIDLLIENNGTLYPIEIKKHADPQKSDAKAFKIIDSIPNVKKGQGGIVCLYDNLVTLTEGVKVIPIKYL